MKGNLLLVQWDKSAAKMKAEQLRAAGWAVEIESEDGAQAYKLIRANPPDVVIIDLTRLPSHGRVTAEALPGVKATRDLPIIFVDGKPEDVEKTRAKVSGAVFVTSVQLVDKLSKLAKGAK